MKHVFEKIDSDQRRKVTIIDGLPENNTDSLRNTFARLLRDIGVNWGCDQVEIIERVGNQPRQQNVNKDNQDGRAHDQNGRGPKAKTCKSNLLQKQCQIGHDEMLKASQRKT